MIYKEYIAKAVEYIEENLKNDIDLSDCARACGYSQYHFLRIFKELVGITPANYIRKRRISEIAKLICDNEEYISEIAFSYGFNSKENFIRAFKVEHNILPNEYKHAKNSLKLYEALNLKFTPFKAESEIIDVEGFSLTVYQSNEKSPPNFWNKYNAKKLSLKLSGGKICEDFGVSYWNENENRLDYYIGIRTNEAKGDLSDTQEIYLSGGKYAVFKTPQSTHIGFVNSIHRTWDYINKIWLPSSEYERIGAYEFESYVEQSRTFSEKIYIPIRRKEIKMKKLNVTWDGVYDSTGYLFSFAKALAAAVKNSPFKDYYEDIIASSGFAFRMWVASDLCPSATSIWAFNEQKSWIESGGITCDYIDRLWGQENIEEERRVTASDMIKMSIDNGIAAISWDIGVPEWGLIIGYDDEKQKYATLSITGEEGEMDYLSLGKREIPILNVLTITGINNKSQEDIISDTLKLAKGHLNGEEWCDNKKGLEAYPTLISFFECDFNPDISWNLEYYLGTYAALKWYAWKFFEKYNLMEFSSLYKTVYDSWQKSFELKASTDLSIKENRDAIVKLLKIAEKNEKNFLLKLV